MRTHNDLNKGRLKYTRSNICIYIYNNNNNFNKDFEFCNGHQ